MDKVRRLKLIDIYKRCSDDDLNQMIMEGKESYEDGAYELILAELEKRKPGNEADKDTPVDEFGYEAGEEINFEEISTEDLMGILVNMHTLDELNFHLAAVEAIRRNIDSSDIRAYKKVVQCNEHCSENTDSEEIQMIENPQTLIILNTIDEASLYADALEEDGIPFEVQINIDDRDYKRAEIATGDIMLPTEED